MKIIFTSTLFVLFQLSFFAQVPSNNECINAINLTDLNNFCDQQLFGEPTFDITDGPCAPTFIPALNIWYKFTAVGSGVTIGAAAGANIYKITLLKFSSGPCTDEDILDCNVSSLTYNNLSIGDEYYIIISSGNAAEYFELCINNPLPAPPPNNEPCNAIVLESEVSSCGTTVDATPEFPGIGVPCPNIGNNQVWYQINVPSDQLNLEISLQAASLSGGVQLILGQWTNGCSGTFQFAETNTYCGPANNTFEFNCLQPGNYYILLSSSNGGAGDFCLTTKAFGSPQGCGLNDKCTDAAAISGIAVNGSPVCISGCSIGACGEDFTSPGCNYNNPVLWYSVAIPPGASLLNITINSPDASLSNPQIQLFTGGCDALQAQTGCFIGANGKLNVLSLPVDGGTVYHLAVGSHSGTAGNFDICVSIDDFRIPCLIESTMVPLHTSLGSPLSGPYQSGEDVTFSYMFTYSSMSNGCQWPHGVVPVFGSCWDLSKSDLDDTGFGNWRWFNEGIVTYKTYNPYILSYTGADALQKLCHYLDPNCSGEPLFSGKELPAGWFYTQGGGPCANQSDPNNSWGQNCNGCESSCQINFQFTLRAKSFEDCDSVPSTSDCGVQVFVFSDRQTGCWLDGPENTCIDDTPTYFNSSLTCCKGPVVEAAELDICSGTAINIELKSDEDEFGVTYEWNVESSGGLIGATSGIGPVISQNLINTASNVRFVRYAVRGKNNIGCVGEISYVTVYVRPEINTTILTNPLNGCIEESFDISASSVGGFGAPYSYLWSYQQSSDSIITDLTPGMDGDFPISVTVTDVAGCTAVASTIVKVGPIEEIEFQMEKAFYCYNEGLITLKANPPGGEWSSVDPEIMLVDNVFDTRQLDKPGTYQFVYVSDADNCYFSDTISIEVIFSLRDCPDRVMEIKTEPVLDPILGTISSVPWQLNLSQSAELRIYDTLGRELYFSSNYQNDWNPDKYPAGMYFFIFTIDGMNYQKVISLIK